MTTTKGGPTGSPFVMPVKQTRSKDDLGFTLIELMIVVAIIGVLAAVALPKFAQLIEKSREAATKGNLGALRSAVFIYYGDHEGVQPETLDTSANYSFSNYMEEILPVKATHSGVGAGTVESPSGDVVWHTSDESITGTGTGWRYHSLTGHLFVNSSAVDSKGNPYSTYGY